MRRAIAKYITVSYRIYSSKEASEEETDKKKEIPILRVIRRRHLKTREWQNLEYCSKMQMVW